MKALLTQHKCESALLATKPTWVVDTAWDEMLRSAHSVLILCLGDRVLREVNKEMTAVGIWTKLETLYMKKTLANRLYLKKKLNTFYMHSGKKQSEHIDEFHKLVDDLAAIDTAISDEDQVLLLFTSLPSSYGNFMEALLYARETLKLEDVLATLNSKELQKMTEAKGDGGEGLYMRGRSDQRDMKQGRGSVRSKSRGRGSKLRCYICNFEEHLKRDCPKYNQNKSQDFVKNKDQVFGSRADVSRRRHWFNFEEYDGGNVLLGDDRECRVLRTGKVQVQMRDGSSFVLDNVRVISIKQGMLEPVKVKCIFLGYHKGTSLVHVLQGVEFEVKPQVDHAFEVEPLTNVGQRAGSHKVQTQDLIYYHSSRDREQHSAWKLFSYREDNNEDAFAVATVDKIYAHASLTFKNTVACEAEIWATKGLMDKVKRNVLGMHIVKDQSGNALRMSQSRFYNGKLVHTLLERHSILSLEGSLSGDCDVENN
ncbi:retrovirus-related pol polyprotein from transposon TNT 1-94, partial [Tanacetum coccineum]